MRADDTRLTTLPAMLALALICSITVASAADPSAGHIKALSAEDVALLLAGKGMGFAKAAELNGYPGPLHVLELAESLALTPEQRTATRELFGRMQAAARKEGAALIEAERRLDHLYATHRATRAAVEQELSRIEAIRTRLRGVHLDAHLEQAGLLNAGQIAAYARLRGVEARHH